VCFRSEVWCKSGTVFWVSWTRNSALKVDSNYKPPDFIIQTIRQTDPSFSPGWFKIQADVFYSAAPIQAMKMLTP
jgi:hypothetical protein